MTLLLRYPTQLFTQNPRTLNPPPIPHLFGTSGKFRNLSNREGNNLSQVNQQEIQSTAVPSAPPFLYEEVQRPIDRLTRVFSNLTSPWASQDNLQEIQNTSVPSAPPFEHSIGRAPTNINLTQASQVSRPRKGKSLGMLPIDENTSSGPSAPPLPQAGEIQPAAPVFATNQGDSWVVATSKKAINKANRQEKEWWQKGLDTLENIIDNTNINEGNVSLPFFQGNLTLPVPFLKGISWSGKNAGAPTQLDPNSGASVPTQTTLARSKSETALSRMSKNSGSLAGTTFHQKNITGHCLTMNDWESNVACKNWMLEKVVKGMLMEILSEIVTTKLPGQYDWSYALYMEEAYKFAFTRFEALVETGHILPILTPNAIGFHLPNRPLCWISQEGHLTYPTYYKEWFSQLIGLMQQNFAASNVDELMNQYQDEYVVSQLLIEPIQFFKNVEAGQFSQSSVQTNSSNTERFVGGITQTVKGVTAVARMPFGWAADRLKETNNFFLGNIGGGLGNIVHATDAVVDGGAHHIYNALVSKAQIQSTIASLPKLPALNRNFGTLYQWIAIQELVAGEVKSVENSLFHGKYLGQVPNELLSFSAKNTIRLQRALNKNSTRVINKSAKEVYQTQYHVATKGQDKNVGTAIIGSQPFQNATSKDYYLADRKFITASNERAQAALAQNNEIIYTFPTTIPFKPLSKEKTNEAISQFVTHVFDSNTLGGVSEKHSQKWESTNFASMGVPDSSSTVITTGQAVVTVGLIVLLFLSLRLIFSTFIWPVRFIYLFGQRILSVLLFNIFAPIVRFLSAALKSLKKATPSNTLLLLPPSNPSPPEETKENPNSPKLPPSNPSPPEITNENLPQNQISSPSSVTPSTLQMHLLVLKMVHLPATLEVIPKAFVDLRLRGVR